MALKKSHLFSSLRQSCDELRGEPTQEMILTLLRAQHTMTRKEPADRIGLTLDGIKYHLGKLRQAGRIRHADPTKKGYWKILGEDDE
jgi:ATP-dependent DNA helicase RecG